MDRFFDNDFPDGERLPRRMVIELSNETCPQGEVVRMAIDGRFVGDELTDVGWIQEEERKEAERREAERRAAESGAPQDITGARWHDTVHLAFAACLGWSPVLRNLIGLRRRSDPGVELAEDADAAILAEEAIAWAIFCHARNHGTAAVEHEALPPALLDYVRGQAEGFEVAVRTDDEWTHAIQTGIAAMTAMWTHNGGTLVADLNARTLEIRPRAIDPALPAGDLVTIAA